MLKVAGGGISGSLNYQGTWDASTNTPTLASGVGIKGYYYVVSVPGTTNLDGITDWQIGDWAVFNGTIWQKVDNSEAVVSVNGQTGAVVLTAANVGATPNTTYVIAGTGISGGGRLTGNVTINLSNTAVLPATYTYSTVTVDQQGRITSASNGTAPVTSVTGTAPVVSSGGTTPAISMAAANATTNGYLTSTDWTTFNNKQPAGSYVTSVSGTSGRITSTGGTTPVIDLATTAVTAAAYGNASTVGTFTVDSYGRLTAASNVSIAIAVGAVSGAVANTVNVLAGTGLSGGGALTGNVTINLANTAVSAGTYGSATQVAQITIDAQGRITSAANVTVSGGGSGGNVVTNIATITSGTAIDWSNATSVILSWLNNSSSIITWTNTAYAVTANNATILVNYPSAPFTVTLPTATTITGQQFKIKKIDSSGNAVTVATTSAQTIDNASTYSLPTQYRSVTLQSDGSNWWITATTT